MPEKTDKNKDKIMPDLIDNIKPEYSDEVKRAVIEYQKICGGEPDAWKPTRI